ncbi:hypothetical protein CC78DRAFT_543774 [Lojkania enalia]|uniref:BRCT domain-containing protein n=1 Tax=Lojkania enalia TaxID=147567 RepID=A0A9P4KAI5_9PLEO|nr:hypothetical protein CC78DRAFT_543774 [Didymosphaeria enalia]
MSFTYPDNGILMLLPPALWQVLGDMVRSTTSKAVFTSSYSHPPETSQLPLAGAILCCTSIPPEQRTELATVGSQMGATIKLDLTSDVTHLIVGNINSAKYRYVAKSREDVKVLLPKWLEALRTVWMGGDDVDVTALEKSYRLPTFYGLKICLTGFDNPDQRKFIQESVTQNGAEYHGDLTKTVTHLIAATPSGKKYEHAVNWRLKIVSWEWFQQSLERGMVLDENYFHPTMAVEKRGRGAWDRPQRMSPVLGKRAREAEQGHSINPLKRKLRRSASSKMGSQSEALWTGITSAGFKNSRDPNDEWTDEGVANQSLPRENSATTTSSNVAMLQQDDHGAELENPASDVRRPFAATSNQSDGIFGGCIVLVYGFDNEKTEILCNHLDSNAAVVVRDPTKLETFSTDDLRRGYLVIPHDAATDLSSLPESSGGLCVATNWWVERCLHGKCRTDPTENVLCRPFDKPSVSGFGDLIVSSTGFTGIELLHVTKVVKLMGAGYDEYLSSKTSVMVCNTRKPNPEKFKFVTEKRIPAVHATWLWDCLETGELQPYHDYLLNSLQGPKPHVRPTEQFTEVPTAPLSEEDSAKLRKKKSQAARHARNALQKSCPLDLTMSADPTPTSTESHTNPNTTFEHDESLTVGFDGPASQPLQDINPNSPRRPSTSSNASTNPKSKFNSASTSRSNSTSGALPKAVTTHLKQRHTKQPSPDSVIPPQTEPAPTGPPPLEKDYTSIMTDLLAARKAAASKIPGKEDEKWKRRRQLGRAQSTRSNPSTADDPLSRASSGSAALGNMDEGGIFDLVGEGRNEGKGYVEYQPSQELGWDAPGAQEARKRVIVKDVVSEPSGLRTGRRKRN